MDTLTRLANATMLIFPELKEEISDAYYISRQEIEENDSTEDEELERFACRMVELTGGPNEQK